MNNIRSQFYFLKLCEIGFKKEKMALLINTAVVELNHIMQNNKKLLSLVVTVEKAWERRVLSNVHFQDGLNSANGFKFLSIDALT